MTTIMLRRMDTALWNQFRARAAAEGIGPRELIMRIMAAYVNTAAPPPRPVPPAPPLEALEPMHTCGNCGRRFKIGTTCPHSDGPWTAPPRRV